MTPLYESRRRLSQDMLSPIPTLDGDQLKLLLFIVERESIGDTVSISEIMGANHDRAYCVVMAHMEALKRLGLITWEQEWPCTITPKCRLKLEAKP